MRCVELKIGDKEKIDPFGNLVTASAVVLWKSEGKHAKQQFHPGQPDCKPLFINVSINFYYKLSLYPCYFSQTLQESKMFVKSSL